MAINLESLSITSAFNSIVNYFRSQENNSKWKELSIGSEGSFLIRLLANVISTLSYRIVAQSRENYLSTASLISSNIGIAVNLGYSVFRGSNLKRKIQIIPNGNYTLSKFSVIGSYGNNYSILTLNNDELILHEGEPVEIETVVGNLREESFIAGTSDPKIFSLFTDGISEDYVLIKDNAEVPTTNVVKELADDKFLVRTNPYSSVDIAYLNNSDRAKYRYGTGTEFTIRYVELADVPVVPYTSSMFTYGELTNYSTISLYIPFESVDSVKLRAPIDHEVQNLIRSKVDYANALYKIIPSIREVNFNPLTPTYTQVTYLKNDFSLLSGTKLNVGTSKENEILLIGTEVEKVNDLLKDQNYFGTPLPDITVPRREVADLKIQLALTNKYKSISDINLDIDNILKNYYNKYLAVTFNTFDLERLLENLSYVKYARVSYAINERETSTAYQLGYMIKQADKYYKVSKILGYTAEEEPGDGWNIPMTPDVDIDTLAVIQDGSVYWKCYKRLPNVPNISKRTPNWQYGIGDFMYLETYPDYMFKCIDIARNSGNTRPSTLTSNLGDFIVDGGVVWVVTDRRSEAPQWVSFMQYRLGDIVNATGDNYSLECVSYTGATGSSSSLPFEQVEYAIKGINEVRDTFIVDGNQTSYFIKNDIIQAVYTEGYTTFVVLDCNYDALLNVTDIKVKRYQDGEGSVIDPLKDYSTLIAVERGTRDGGVLWTLVETPDVVSYNWNSFVNFSHTLEIVE
jgi:hypothetical protein